MQVGDWVRRIKGFGLPVGHVYQIRQIDIETGNLFLHGFMGGWHAEKFEPFVWKVGDSCKIARPGCSISDAPNTIIPMSSLPIGKLTELNDGIYNRTDIPNPIYGNGLLVKLSQLDFVNPDGSVVSFGEEEVSETKPYLAGTAAGLSTPPVDQKPATEAKQPRYINRGV